MYSEYGELIIQAFEKVVIELKRLCLHLYDDLMGLPIWIANTGNQFENNRKGVFCLENFNPTSGLTSKETFSCPGVIAGTSETLKRLEVVHQSKDALKKVIADCKSALGNRAHRFVHDILARAGYPAIKLKQVYRHIYSINYHPDRIAWCKGKSSSHKVITQEEAKTLLAEAGQGSHIDIQIDKLKTLKPGEKLVIRRPVRANWVVNVTATSEMGALHEDFRTSLPLIYLQDANKPPPIVCFSTLSNRDETSIRSDRKIELTPFLPSIKAYCYFK